MAETITQGLGAYVIESDDTVTSMGCLFEADKISAPRSDIDTTGLCATSSKSYIAGLKDPGDTTWTLKYVKGDTAGAKLQALWDSGDIATFAVGLSESTDAPTSTSGTITWPTTRTWVYFKGYVKDVPFTTEKDGIVTCEVSIKMAEAHTIKEAA